jgi:hypothetical protein
VKHPLRASFSSPGWRYAAFLLVTMASLFALVAPGCSSSDVASKQLQLCSLNSDCASNLVCALGRCRNRCATAADCNGGACITDGPQADGLQDWVCQPPAEKNAPCDKPTDCPKPLACATDYRCRNLCAVDTDCNKPGSSDSVCATDAQGVHYCAVPTEVTGGVITAPPPPGARDVAVTEPPDATVTPPGEGGSGNDGPAGNDGTTGPDGPVSMADSGPGVDAPAGDGNLPCSSPCAQGTTCVNGGCVACGTSGAACCPGARPCGANLSCNGNGVCSCGGANEACCGGNTCNAGLSCPIGDAAPLVCACGTIGTACCPVSDAGTSSCSASAVCAGTRCSCIAEFAPNYYGGLVRRVDGTIWSSYYTTASGAYVQVTTGAGPLRGSTTPTTTTNWAPQIAASNYTGNVGCAIVGGGVYCFPLGGTLADSTYLGAGLGATATSAPVQVVTSVGGTTPLTNVTQLTSGTYGSNPNFCAVTSDMSAWCWGYGAQGQLGHGDMSTSSYARQVMSNASTPLAGVVEVRIGYESACARLMDATVWCWGTNTYAELGVPYGSTAPALTQSLYPVQVPFLGSTVSAARLAANPVDTHCAIMTDASVVCWGYNSSYFTAGSTVTTPAGVGPTSVLVGAGGPGLTGVIDLASDSSGNSMCALLGSGLALECWGNTRRAGITAYPTTYQDNHSTAVAGIRGTLAGDYYGLGYVDPSGVVTYNTTATTSQPSCANLLP